MSTTSFVDNSTLIQASWLNDVDSIVYGGLTSVAGTNTITATGPASMTAYATRQVFWFIPANSNTGITTLNITPSGGTALGAKNIFFNGSDCLGGEIQANRPTLVIYDGTQFNIAPSSQTYQTFTATITGCTSSTAYTVQYVKDGSRVTISVPNLTGTSSTLAKSLTGMPGALAPATAKRGPIFCQDNGGGDVAAQMAIAANGVISLYPAANTVGAAANWTSSGLMNVQPFSFTYTLN